MLCRCGLTPLAVDAQHDSRRTEQSPCFVLRPETVAMLCTSSIGEEQQFTIQVHLGNFWFRNFLLSLLLVFSRR